MIGLLLAAGNALAACQLMQTATETGAVLLIQAIAEPLSCRRLTLSAPGGAPKVKVRLEGRKLPRDHIRTVGRRVEIGLPELKVGDEARVDVELVGESLEVSLGEPPIPAPPAETHTSLSVVLDPQHPAWGFADPKFATSTRTVATVSPDGHDQTTIGGAPAQGIERLDPGSFTLDMPGARISTWASPGVMVTSTPTGAHWSAPSGGEARWRVSSAAGAPVIPDGTVFRDGLDWRFTQASFPEPAVPVGFAAVRDPEELARALYAAVARLTPGWLPASEALRPRGLNRAWRSGWATSVERALILHRMLGQSRMLAAWMLTGERAEFLTLTGYDTMLVAARVGEREVLLDPGCAVCAFDEVSTRVAGKPAIGAATLVPLSAGRLERKLTLVGAEYGAEVSATGAAALYLRELAWGLGDARRTEVLASALGLPGAHLQVVEGLEEPGTPMRVTATSKRPPVPPFEGDPPWVGGWSDE